jgi:hypothetical protein
MRALALLALLCLTAGCSGVVPDSTGAGPASPTPTATAAPVPTEVNRSAELAPGVTAEGIEDPNALLAAHQQAIDGKHVGLVTGVAYPEGGPGEHRMHASIGPDRERFYVEDYLWDASSANGSAGTPARILRGYGDTEATYIRIEEENTTRYLRNQPLTLQPEAVPRFSVERLVRTLAVERVNRTGDDIRIEGHPTRPISSIRESGRLEAVNVTIVVAPSGRLRYVDFRYPVAHDGGIVPAIGYVNYLGVGVGEVAKPGWLPTAREATANETVETPRTRTATA